MYTLVELAQGSEMHFDRPPKDVCLGAVGVALERKSCIGSILFESPGVRGELSFQRNINTRQLLSRVEILVF